MSRIREAGGPIITYYTGNASSLKKLPKEINGVTVKFAQNNSKKSISSRKRSMSASSSRSIKNTRAPRKKPASFANGNDEILLTSKYR